MATRNPNPQPLPVWAKARPDGSGLVLALYVQPGARVSGPAGRHGEALKIRIAAPAADNKANEALTGFLQEKLGVPRARIRIAHGRSSRHKMVAISAESQALAAQLNAWDRGAEQ
ncbi:MAG: DUF167 domain-containing protein [Burkholderiales bacterium]|nr:DUF167 domain-containing protein [Burkholderiales bacterium]